MSRRRARQANAILGCIAFVLLAAFAPPASAATWTTVRTSYLHMTDFYSQPLGMCLHVGVDGSVQFEQSGSSKRNPAIVNPHIYVVTKQTCARTSPLVYTSTGADLVQSWFHHSCSTSFTISGGFPWSVGVTATRTCGNHTVAERDSAPRKSGGSGFDQYNTGSPVHWSSSSTCLEVVESVVVYKGGRSDSVAVPDWEVCG